jgi:cobyrinic acid a,c-diamide synthase
MPRHRIVIAGTHSGVGKTTVATALMCALRRRGHRVQGFKAGPDFIDPTFHQAATGRPSHNLDGWMLSREANLALFEQAMRGADVAVVEGVMGLFDGRDATSAAGSTAELARWLDAPVILIVDAAAMAGSVAALVRGFEEFDPALRIGGVIFNRAAGAGHAALLAEALAAHCRARSLGELPREAAIELPERHLGLKLAEEVLDDARLNALADWVERHVDLDRLLRIGADASPAAPAEQKRAAAAPPPARTRIGIARDRAFCFYYQDNLDLLRSLGAELVEFSPIADAHLPAGLGGLYLGGGYPELHAAALSANATLRAEVAAFARSSAPVYAECGGFMYLCAGIIGAEGAAHPMAGVFPAWARMQPRLAALGYVEVEAGEAAAWLPAGVRARGHEFRYSTVDPMPPRIDRVYRIDSRGAAPCEGYRAGAAIASYVHLHFRSCPSLAAAFVAASARQESK